MFELLSGCQVGLAHEAMDVPCQDAVASRSTQSGIALACADGAGSRPRSQLGARVAVASATDYAARWIGTPGMTAEEIVLAAVEQAAQEVAFTAEEAELAPDDLACTLAVCAIDATTVACATVGDAICVLRGTNGRVRPIAMAPASEFASQTTFLTVGDIAPHIVHDVQPVSEVDGVLLSSDGLDRVLVCGSASAPFAYPGVAHTLLDGDDAELSAFLADPAVRGFTRDDLSIVLARRRPNLRGRVVRLLDGREIHVEEEPVQPWSGGRVAYAVTDSPGLFLVELGGPARSDLRELLVMRPNVWTLRGPLPLLAWPAGAAVDPDGQPWALLYRYPGGAAVADVDEPVLRAEAEACVAALHAAGLAHGELQAGAFLCTAAGQLCLADLAPAFLADQREETAHAADRAFLDALMAPGVPSLSAGGKR